MKIILTKKDFLIFLSLISMVTFQLISYQLPVLAKFKQPIAPKINSLVCYMQTESGVVLNLTNLCQPEKVIQFLSERDRKFIKDYKKLLVSYPQGQTILSIAEDNPELIIKKASQICNELKTGIVSEQRINRPDIDADVLNYIAPEYYCPEFSD